MSELGAAFRDIFDSFARELHTWLPGEVVKYDAAAQTVDVQPLVKRVVVDEDGNEAVESMPQIVNVPLGFLATGGYQMTMPVAVGDTGIIFFSELPIDTWLATGKESDPGDLRHHALGDACFAPIVRATSKKLTDVSTDSLAIGKSGGPQIHVGANYVALYNKAAADTVALASKVDAAINTIVTAFNAHVHPTALGPSGAPAAPISPAPASVASTKIKAE